MTLNRLRKHRAGNDSHHQHADMRDLRFIAATPSTFLNTLNRDRFNAHYRA
jgi:hypothetical protein